jgi:hypothetical protein
MGRDALAFQFGRVSVLRSTSELVEQLQTRLKRERAQHFIAEEDRELA